MTKPKEKTEEPPVVYDPGFPSTPNDIAVRQRTFRLDFIKIRVFSCVFIVMCYIIYT